MIAGSCVAGKKGGRRAAPELVLVAGEQPQMRKRSGKSWSKAKEEVFLATLAETCNVTRACEAAGVGVTTVYRQKKENAAFRAQWLAALSLPISSWSLCCSSERSTAPRNW
jgi:hypothetical protein